MSFDRLIEKIIESRIPVLLGWTQLSYIPSFIREDVHRRYGKTPEGAAAAILAYNKGLIDALVPLCRQSSPSAPIMRSMAGRACALCRKPLPMRGKRACL